MSFARDRDFSLMKTLEYNHNGNWLDRVLNSWPFCLDTEKIIPIWAFVFCKYEGWQSWPVKNDSLFYNGLFFIRVMRPFWIGFSIRVRDCETCKSYLQVGVGWKLNGRFGAIFRVQSDVKAAQGAHENAPNSGHSNGWSCGNK